MIDRECHCLLCRGPVEGNYWDDRDRRTAEHITSYGWSAVGVSGDETDDWTYTVGLWHTLGSPEVAIFGLSPEIGTQIVNTVGDQVRDGRPLEPDERRADVVEGYDLAVRPVHPSWYMDFFGTAVDFYQQPPLPVVQLFWPDPQGRFGWERGADPGCARRQPMLWLDKQDHPRGAWTDQDPSGGWPFGTTLPYHPVQATQQVLDGEPVIQVHREADGAWHFRGLDEGALIETTLRRIVDTDPGVAAVGDLPPGGRAVRSGDETWMRKGRDYR